MALDNVDDIDTIEQIAFEGIRNHARLGNGIGGPEKNFPGIRAKGTCTLLYRLLRPERKSKLVIAAPVPKGTIIGVSELVPRRKSPWGTRESQRPSFAFTMEDTLPMSARPASLGLSSAITLPMSCIVLAPVAAKAAVTSAAISASESCCGI